MPKTETSFWLIFMAGVFSAFCGVIVAIMLLPALKQLFSEHGKYVAIMVAVISSGILFGVSHHYVFSLLKKY